MSIFKSIKNIKNRLTTIGNKEPLNFLSILLLIALDIFVIFNLFQGLDRQARQLASPNEKIPYQCISLIQNNSNKINFIKDIHNKGEDRYYYNQQFKSASYQRINDSKNSNIISECQEVYNAAIGVNEDKNIKILFNKIDNFKKNINRINSSINTRRNNYDTMLLEKIAGQEEDDSIIIGKADQVKIEIANDTNRIDQLNLQKKNLENQILSSGSVRNFLNIISQNKEVIKEAKKTEEFWYPLKKYGIKFLFIFPLFLIFWFLYKRTSKNKSSVSSLIFAHLLVVTSVPIIFSLFEMIFNILPFHFFADFFKFLEVMNLASVVNYILIFGGILVTLFLVYIIQKKLFSRQRIFLKRIGKNQCHACGANIDNIKNYCYKCGEQIYIECKVCGQKTHKVGEFCEHCGTKDFKYLESTSDS